MLATYRGGVESHHVLGGEDHDTGRVQAEQFHFETFPARGVPIGARDDPARDRLDYVDDYGNGDEEPGDVIEHESGSSGVRVLEGPPHPFSDGGRRMVVHSVCLLVLHQSLDVLPLPVAILLVAAVADYVGHDAEEGHLFLERCNALRFRVVHLSRPVVAENVPEEVGIAVEKELPTILVVEEFLLVRAEQGVRELFQRVSPSLENLSAHVDPDFLVGMHPVGRYRRRGQLPLRDGHPPDGRRPDEG